MKKKKKEIQDKKTGDLSRKLEIPKTFLAAMGTIKDRNGMDLTEIKDIKKRWQEYTEEPYKKYLNDPDNHNGVFFFYIYSLVCFSYCSFSLAANL